MVRIAYVVDNAGLHSAERTVLQLVGGLSRSRYETGVVCSPGGQFVDRLHDLGVPVLATDMRSRRGREAARLVAGELRRFGPALVHTHGRADPLVRLAARIARARLVVSSVLEVPEGRVERSARGVLGRVADIVTDRFVDRYVVTSRAMLETLVGRLHVASSKVAIIPHGIDLKFFQRTRTRGSWRRRLGVAPGAVLLGALGRLTSNKGFVPLLRAFAGLENEAVRLVIAGEGPEWEELHTLARAFGVVDRVVFLGFVDDVAGLLADIDVFVLPSLAGAHPLVLLEAMAMARPVIATDTGGTSDAVSDGVDGRLVPAGDVAALRDAMERMIGDPGNARRMGYNARRKMEREYSVERMIRRTDVLYEELLAGASGRLK